MLTTMQENAHAYGFRKNDELFKKPMLLVLQNIFIAVAGIKWHTM